MIRVVFFGLLGYVFLFLSDYAFLELRYKNYPNYIDVVKRLDRDPENPGLQQEARKEYEKIMRE